MTEDTKWGRGVCRRKEGMQEEGVSLNTGMRIFYAEEGGLEYRNVLVARWTGCTVSYQ